MRERTWDYKLIERPGIGLALFQFESQRHVLFARMKLRKLRHHSCASYGEKLQIEAYRPITNKDNRMHRICLACAEKIPLRK